MLWDENNKNGTINHVYRIIEFIDKKIIKRFDAILKLVILN